MNKRNRGLLLFASVIAATAAFLVMPAVSYAQSEPDEVAPAPARDRMKIPTIPGVPRLTVANAKGGIAHMMPNVQTADRIKRAVAAAGFANAAGPLYYHAGGSIMTPGLQIYTIFWVPATLQDGSAASMSNTYKTVQNNLAKYFAGHALTSIHSQYYQIIGGVKTYINGLGKDQTDSLGGTAYAANAFPARDSVNCPPSPNCLTDAQIEAQIHKVMNLKGWTGGMNKIFLLYTPEGMESCYDTNNCSTNIFCAYHSYFYVNGKAIIYGNEPYATPNGCQDGGPSPNGDAAADSAASIASHEISEAMTDPLLDAWYATSGDENGDLCAWDFGTLTWKRGTANQMWAGHYFRLQQEYSNHQARCKLVGP